MSRQGLGGSGRGDGLGVIDTTSQIEMTGVEGMVLGLTHGSQRSHQSDGHGVDDMHIEKNL